MNSLAARRRHPAAIAILLMLGLFLTGAVYAVVAPKDADATTKALPAQSVEEGQQLFRANCASCHGLNAEGRATGNGDKIAGPALAGVGAAAVDFQVGTGRMPLAGPMVQAPAARRSSSPSEQIDALGAYIASLAPGPAGPAPTRRSTPPRVTPAEGGELFRVNCAMCHNFAGAGGALTRGKYAPGHRRRHGQAHLRGHGHRPAEHAGVQRHQPHPREQARRSSPSSTPSTSRRTRAAWRSGSLGPVTEGLFAWVFGLGILVGCAVWLGSKSA